jgi:uncharacterized membrane protein
MKVIRLLFAGVSVGMLACTSTETPTEPSAKAGPTLAAVRTYTAVDLGTLPGGTHSSAVAINSAAQVVGQSGTTGGVAARTGHGPASAGVATLRARASMVNVTRSATFTVPAGPPL